MKCAMYQNLRTPKTASIDGCNHTMTNRSYFSITQILIFLAICTLSLAFLKATNVWVGINNAGASTGPSFVGTPILAERQATEASDETAPTPTNASAPGPSEPFADIAQHRTTEPLILQRLAERNQTLDERETALEIREHLIEAAEIRLEERLDVLRQEQTRLTDLQAIEEARQTEDLASLVTAYERMKARDAAQIFDALDDDLMVSVATRMRTQALAGVLAEMTPARARILTKLLATPASSQNTPEDETTRTRDGS